MSGATLSGMNVGVEHPDLIDLDTGDIYEWEPEPAGGGEPGYAHSGDHDFAWPWKALEIVGRVLRPIVEPALRGRGVRISSSRHSCRTEPARSHRERRGAAKCPRDTAAPQPGFGRAALVDAGRGTQVGRAEQRTPRNGRASAVTPR